MMPKANQESFLHMGGPKKLPQNQDQILQALIQASALSSGGNSAATPDPNTNSPTRSSKSFSSYGIPVRADQNTASHTDYDGVALSFPQKLMEILDEEKNSDIISWLPHGKAFFVFDKIRFEQQIMPRFFQKQSKYSSFTRKLNRWGFTRVTRGPEVGSYCHSCFQKGNYRLVSQMSCDSSGKAAKSKVVSYYSQGNESKGSDSPGLVPFSGPFHCSSSTVQELNQEMIEKNLRGLIQQEALLQQQQRSLQQQIAQPNQFVLNNFAQVSPTFTLPTEPTFQLTLTAPIFSMNTSPLPNNMNQNLIGQLLLLQQQNPNADLATLLRRYSS